MSKLRRILSAAAIMLFAVAAALFAVACDSKSYTLKFETNGGTAIESITAAAGDAITPPANPEKEGYGFDGWYLNADFSGGKVEIPSVMPNNDVTYYAKYSNIYRITFETYGALPINPITGRAGDTITSPADPQKGGYTFEGWYLNENFTGNPVSIPNTMPATNTTYYAKFVRRLSVNYRLNLWKTDSSGNPIGEVEHTGEVTKTDCRLGDTVTVKENGYQVPGYRFLGWSVNEDGPISVTGEKKDGQYAPGDTIDITEEKNVTLYAQWEQKFKNDKFDYIIYASTSFDSEGSFGAFELGSARYVDKKTGKETLGYIKLSYTLDVEYFVKVDGTDYIGKVGETEEDGAFFEPRSLEQEGFYSYYDWMTEKTEQEVLYVSGYPSDFEGAYNTAIRQQGTVFNGFMIQLDDIYLFLGEDVYGAKPTLITTFRMDWEQKRFMIRGSEYDAAEGQEGKWIFTDGISNLGNDGYLLNNSIELDGFGNATVYRVNEATKELEAVCTGTYKANGDYYLNYYGEWTVTLDPATLPEGMDATFNISLRAMQTTDGTVYNCYLQIIRKTYTSASGNSTLEIVSTGEAKYIDENNIERNGSFSYATDDVIFFLQEQDPTRYYFKITGETFEKLTLSGDWVTDENTLICYNGSQAGTQTAPVQIPDGITAIANYAFAGAEVEYLDLNKVQRIGMYAFMGCEALQGLKAENVTAIGDSAFFGCISLKTLTLPAIETIGGTAFIGANALENLTLGEHLRELGAGAFATDGTSAQSFTVEFEGTTPPVISDLEGSAMLVYGRNNVTMHVSSSQTLLNFWKGEGWEYYIVYLRFTYSPEETDALEKYYGAYFTSGFESIQLGEGLTYVTGVPALILFENGSPVVYLFDKTAENNYRKLDGITFGEEDSDGNVISITYLTDDGTETFHRLAVQEYTFVSEATQETLKFTPSAEEGEKYASEGQFVVYASYTHPDYDDEGNKIQKTETFSLIVAYLEESGVTVEFVRGSYTFIADSWNWTGNADGNTFTAQFQEQEIPFYSYAYLKQQTPFNDILAFVQKDYLLEQGFYARGVFNTLKDMNGNPLVLDDEVIIPLGADPDGSLYLSIEFIYDGYRKADGYDQDYDGDGYLYSIQLVAWPAELTSSAGVSEEYVFVYTYMRSQAFSFETVTDGDDTYSVTVYTYHDSDMFNSNDDTVREPDLGELIHAVIVLKGATEEDDVMLDIVELTRDETDKNVYKVIAVNEDETQQTEYTLTLTVTEEGTGSDKTVTVTGVTLAKGETTDYVPPAED